MLLETTADVIDSLGYKIRRFHFFCKYSSEVSNRLINLFVLGLFISLVLAQFQESTANPYRLCNPINHNCSSLD